MDSETMLLTAQSVNNTLISVGLDGGRVNEELIRETAGKTCAFKIDPAAYLFAWQTGLFRLTANIRFIRKHAPGIPIILDWKFSGSAHANESFAKLAYERLRVDAVTINPYNGMDTFEPFFAYKGKFTFVVCKTSNEGSGEFQDRLVPIPGQAAHAPHYQYVALRVAEEWQKKGRCGLVVGATYPNALKIVRSIIGENMLILSPGGGAIQGGDVKEAMRSGKNQRGDGIIMHFSRQIENAVSPGEEAERCRAFVNAQRQKFKEVAQ